jgi:hypothetical protein
MLPDHLRSWLLTAYTAMIWVQGNLERTESLASETLRLFQEAGDEAGIALSYHHLATVADHPRVDFEAALWLRERGLEHARNIADSWYASVLLQSMGDQLHR